MKTVIIYRTAGNEKLTLGNCTVYNNGYPSMSCVSLERGDNNNEPMISCVPIGTYELVYEYSPRFNRMLWELKNVPNRAECKFHAGNFWHQLNGCIALGRAFGDIDKDGYMDITASQSTMKAFHKSMSGVTEAKLIIKESKHYNGI